MSDTVLIAPLDKLTELSARPDLASAIAYADTDAMAALDAIVKGHPAVVALDESFAGTPRGAALIDRIKADPALDACEVRIIGPAPEARSAEGDRSAATAGPQAAALDAQGTRRVARIAMRQGVTVSIDGNPATLLDLSVDGAQVVAAMTLRPHQHVRVALPASPRPIRLQASVRWATFEMPKEGPRFRAGLQFSGADPSAVGSFIDTHRAL